MTNTVTQAPYEIRINDFGHKDIDGNTKAVTVIHYSVRDADGPWVNSTQSLGAPGTPFSDFDSLTPQWAVDQIDADELTGMKSVATSRREQAEADATANAGSGLPNWS